MLAQSEIDDLLTNAANAEKQDEPSETLPTRSETAGIQSEGRREKTVQAYNFGAPARFSKEQMRAVELIHEDMNERMATSLPTFLRTNVRSRLTRIEQGRFHDFIKEFPQNSLFHLISMTPLPGHIVLTMSQNISYLILELRLGGKIEGRFSERALTEIDQSLLRGLVEHILIDMKGAWNKVASIDPALEDSTINHHWVQMVMGNERVIQLTLEINIQGISGTMSMFIPFNTLKPIADILNPHIWIAGHKELQHDPASRQRAIMSTLKVTVPVTVLLGHAELTLGDLLHLATGDVIELNENINDPLVVQVANKKQFLARVGKANKRLGVQITAPYQEADET